MIDIVRIDHISIAVADAEPQIELLERLFGFRFAGRFEEEGFIGHNLDVPGVSGMSWEVLMPNGPESYLHRFLEGSHGPGIHHITIQIRDIRQAAEAMREQGFEPWAERPGDEQAGEPRGVTYIHPGQGGHGFLYQLYAGEPWHTAEPYTDDGEHTLGIRAVNHLGHAYPDRELLADWYERVLGCRTVYRSPGSRDESGTGFRTQVLETPTEQMRFEIIEPAGPDSFVQHFLERRGPSIHHVTFEVQDWDRAMEACQFHGVPTFGERVGETDGVAWREAFIHPRHTGGMLVQFFWEASPGVWI